MSRQLISLKHACNSVRQRRTPFAAVVGKHFARAAQTDTKVSICLEGNISSGKSTFLKEVLSRSSGIRDLIHTVPEPVQSWQNIPPRQPDRAPHNLLKEFYNDPHRYAYTFQNYVFMTRYLQERGSSNFSTPLRILERSVFSDRNVFVESVREHGWLSELEGDLYNAWLSPMIMALPTLVPDGFIYLRARPDVCMRRLQQRARGEELNVTSEYLQSLHDKHEKWLLNDVREVIVDSEQLNISFISDTACGTFQEKPVLIVEYDDEIDFNARNLDLQAMVKQVWKFYEFISSTKA